ncbi:MAG: GntR family transcriptional regulator, partial [Solirubrobacterales bacterium]|nr:GntR family transcriptional regulator [Solirubrobacterales bacterium]
MTGANLTLPVTIERDSPLGLSQQLQDAIRDLINRGGLLEGALLPPSRQLAADLGVSRNVVLDAYSQLRHEGLLATRTGSGTRVGSRARRSPPVRDRQPPWLDLHPDVTDLAGFPRAAWGRAIEAALRE